MTKRLAATVIQLSAVALCVAASFAGATEESKPASASTADATALISTQPKFDVVPHHEYVLEPSPDGSPHRQLLVGVRFNVENRTARAADMNKSHVSAQELRRAAEKEGAAFYAAKVRTVRGRARRGEPPLPPPRIEVMSATPDTLVYAGADGLLKAALTAFAQHLPLSLSPDQLWSAVGYAFARHVEANAEALRHHFVQFEGKKRLVVSSDDIVPGGSPPADWEASIFPQFANQIRRFVEPEVFAALTEDFSTTDATARAVAQITLMGAMKSYFSYGMGTLCGIPDITLRGTRGDWVALRNRVEALSGRMVPEFAERWMAVLLPILDQFVAAYDGQVDHTFWQRMVKLRNNGAVSGYREWVSGWIQNFFPYLVGGEPNPYLKPWQDAWFSGPEPENFPKILSSAPVDWNHFGSKYKVHFHAGFVGFTQEPATGRLEPTLGWRVTHDPPMGADVQLATATEEIGALGRYVAAEECGPDECLLERERIRQLEAEVAHLQVPEGPPLAAGG